MTSDSLQPISKDFLRVLRPLDERTLFEPSGLPLELEQLPCLFNFAAFKNKTALFLSYPDLEIANSSNLDDIEDFLLLQNDFAHTALRELCLSIRKSVPDHLIRTIGLAYEQSVLLYGEAREYNYPHVDEAGLTAMAASPATIFYPQTSPWDYQEEQMLGGEFEQRFYEKHKDQRAFLPPFTPRLWNDRRHVHEAPINDKARQEWLDHLNPYPGTQMLVGDDGSIQSLFVRAILDLHEDRVEEYCAAYAEPAYSLT